MLDTSGSMTATIDLLKAAAEQFLIRLLPEDKARVGAFNDKIEISAALHQQSRQARSPTSRISTTATARGCGTRVGESLDELQGIEGRRVILVFTDGDDTDEPRSSRGTVIDRARAEEVMVYAIGLRERVLRRPAHGAQQAGQRAAEARRRNRRRLLRAEEDQRARPDASSRVAQELHSQYVLGFEAKQLDGKVHKLAVKMKQPGMTARARRSYIAAAARRRSRNKAAWKWRRSRERRRDDRHEPAATRRPIPPSTENDHSRMAVGLPFTAR